MHLNNQIKTFLPPLAKVDFHGILTSLSVPEWRNGRRDGFKIHCPQGCVGSTPTSGINPRNNLRGIFLLVNSSVFKGQIVIVVVV